MSLNLPKKIWIYAERLFIHIYNPLDFVKFLKSFDIEYENKKYASFKSTEPKYTFMSVGDQAFADFMKSVPSYKYLQILEPIVFDDKIIATRKDGWNYYGTYIKNWYPTLTELLKLAEVKIDYENKKLIFEEKKPSDSSADFLQHSFNDPFLDYIRKEANESYQQELYLSVMFLCRKILEVIFIRVLETVFPKTTAQKYNKTNHELWFSPTKNRYHSFDILIKNMRNKASKFQEDNSLVIELCDLIKPFKDETNTCIHADYKIPDLNYLQSWRANHLVNLARKLFKKYYNP